MIGAFFDFFPIFVGVCKSRARFGTFCDFLGKIEKRKSEQKKELAKKLVKIGIKIDFCLDCAKKTALVCTSIGALVLQCTLVQHCTLVHEHRNPPLHNNHKLRCWAETPSRLVCVIARLPSKGTCRNLY